MFSPQVSSEQTDQPGTEQRWAPPVNTELARSGDDTDRPEGALWLVSSVWKTVCLFLSIARLEAMASRLESYVFSSSPFLWSVHTPSLLQIFHVCLHLSGGLRWTCVWAETWTIPSQPEIPSQVGLLASFVHDIS